MNAPISTLIREFNFSTISVERKNELKVLIQYIKSKILYNKELNINFICTHNSRRSQFTQLWAKVCADFYQVPLNSFSGGVEITEFNHRAIYSLNHLGFDISSEGDSNPHYFISWKKESTPLEMFSKLFDDESNPSKEFAAVMTCSHADENCPFVPGCEQRIALRYEDPKEFDDTPLEQEKYLERSLEIAKEMSYIFSQVSSQ